LTFHDKTGPTLAYGIADISGPEITGPKFASSDIAGPEITGPKFASAAMAFDGDFSFVPWVFMRDACNEGTDRPDLRSTLDVSTYQQWDKPDRVERSWENDKVRSRLMELDYQAAWVLHQTEADIMAWVAPRLPAVQLIIDSWPRRDAQR